MLILMLAVLRGDDYNTNGYMIVVCMVQHPSSGRKLNHTREYCSASMHTF
ncbi:hypothetical protein BHAP_0387 [Bifidobacterium hapali]|uniref:Uncharacterized protein n=1 Tax=Bifidobacterium hapali TaxID=1630172 RepID=A0A261G472_9BIFI|nr:hypothetical protein BHAP_0387 [Bifidobacterium hapali]